MSEESRKNEGSEASEPNGEAEEALNQTEGATKANLSAGDGSVENNEKQDESKAPEGASEPNGEAEEAPIQKGADGDATPEESPQEEFMDILGNGTLLKKIHEPGHGKNPQMGEKVTIRIFKAIPEHGKEFPDDEITFILGDCDVEQALDLGVSLMKLGEKATLISGYKYMYGEMGLAPDIPPCANFKLDVHLTTNHGFPDLNKMDLEERFAEAKKKKERGNFYFRRMEYSQAVYVYTKANKIVDPEEGCVYPDASPKLLQELLEFRGIILANTSVAQLKVGAADAAVKSALQATKLCPSYSKAYFRLGQAYEGKGMIDEAIKAHKLALKNDPENSKEVEIHQIIHNELSRLTKLNKESKRSEQEMYSKMFWGSKPPNVANSQKAKEKDTSSMEGHTPTAQPLSPKASANMPGASGQNATSGKSTSVDRENLAELDAATKDESSLKAGDALGKSSSVDKEEPRKESLAELDVVTKAVKDESRLKANLGTPDEAAETDKEDAYKSVSLAEIYEAAQTSPDESIQNVGDGLKGLSEESSVGGSLYAEINQMYARMHHNTWSTDVDSGKIYREELITVDEAPPKDIMEYDREEKKYSWIKNPLLWGTVGAGLAGAVSLGVYRYVNSH